MVFSSVGMRRSVGEALLQVSIILLVLLVLQLVIRMSVSRIVQRVVRSHRYHSLVEEQKREDTLTRIFQTACSAVLWTVGIVVILGTLHVNLAALVTGAGLIGVVLGLGAQSTIKSYLAGIFIITENQYRVGDIITLNGLGVQDGVSGVVEDISIRITKLRDLDGNLHIVSNGTAAVITNRTFQYAKVNVDVPVNYDADIDKVQKIINETGHEMATDEDWQKVILEPIRFLRVDAFNDFSVTVKSLGKVQAAAQWDVAGEFRRRIKKAFQKNDIQMQLPLPQVAQPKTKK